jgi:hypothetical protein
VKQRQPGAQDNQKRSLIREHLPKSQEFEAEFFQDPVRFFCVHIRGQCSECNTLFEGAVANKFVGRLAPRKCLR